MFANILVATHGTPGAQRAEQLAARLAGDWGARLTVLSVVNADWSLMTGDDWLNSSATRNHFADYVEAEIDREMRAVWERIREQIAPLDPAFVRRVGPLEQSITDAARETGADLIVVGTRQQRQAPGFRARLDDRLLHPELPCPLLVAP
ncbi:nucleotide-binding universal stress UspA family protein [Desulfobaculum xiamenense]|uniref:Nucleotide-binding universal stress UspA family protein n=1 Tax=Desulfobaculum xiamenense TaxID=995050 RepID=A0A846QPY9_9BACT|nr:universal stress protein [Desulfobaculum xiamenense]NJB69247.1 nucleotide-binding universal stress UspA family protein [Desulfobaculum xiamenense]